MFRSFADVVRETMYVSEQEEIHDEERVIVADKDLEHDLKWNFNLSKRYMKDLINGFIDGPKNNPYYSAREFSHTGIFRYSVPFNFLEEQFNILNHDIDDFESIIYPKQEKFIILNNVEYVLESQYEYWKRFCNDIGLVLSLYQDTEKDTYFLILSQEWTNGLEEFDLILRYGDFEQILKDLTFDQFVHKYMRRRN